MHPAAVAGAGVGAIAVRFDGPIDEGIEQRGEPRGEPAGAAAAGTGRVVGAARDVGAEAAAHAFLRLVAEHPGQMGRLRAARIVGGYPVPHRDEAEAVELERYAVRLDWPLREITRLVDALISGKLVAQTAGPRPVLVLTRPGYRTLDALEAGPQRP